MRDFTPIIMKEEFNRIIGDCFNSAVQKINYDVAEKYKGSY